MIEPVKRITSDNYSSGFLYDDELMGGITRSKEKPSVFIAFVMRHTTGEYLGYQNFNSLDQAIDAINSVERSWVYQPVSGCGACSEGEGKCKDRLCTRRNPDAAPSS